MDSKSKNISKFSLSNFGFKSYFLGFSIGALTGLPIFYSQNNTIEQLSESYEHTELIEAYETRLHYKERTIKANERSIHLLEEIITVDQKAIELEREGFNLCQKSRSEKEQFIFSQQEGLEALFPELIIKGDTKDIGQSLSQILSVNESQDSNQDNSCLVQTYFIEEGNAFLTSVGNCVFLDSNLALTNYHVVDGGHESVLYDFNLRSVIDTKGRDYNFKVLALSPRYDLALLEILHDGNKDIEPLKIGEINEEETLVNVFIDPNLNEDSWVNERSFSTFYETGDSIGLSQNGNLIFQSIRAEGDINLGDSGSPVYQGGSLVGLIWTKNEGNIGITHHIRPFLSAVIEESTLKEKP